MTTETAPAKINLALHVRARRSDGYHALETLFAFCADGDVVTVAPDDAHRFVLTGPFGAALARDADNLVSRARDAFLVMVGSSARYAITLDKRLPIASGIGGGSADAAACLRLLARAQGVAIDAPELLALALELGSDVPACLLGQSAFADGRGERLVPAMGVTGVPALLVNPGVAVSTARVFGGWDGVDRGPIAPGGSLLDRARAGRNDLERPARALAPVVEEVLALLDAQPGTTLVRMSGSGATCFALFDDAPHRTAAAGVVRRARPDWWRLETVLT